MRHDARCFFDYIVLFFLSMLLYRDCYIYGFTHFTCLRQSYPKAMILTYRQVMVVCFRPWMTGTGKVVVICCTIWLTMVSTRKLIK